MTRVAAVDCGTNTIKLLVVDLDAPTGTASEIVRDLRMVRLGEGVDRTGRLADAALARVFAAIDQFATVIDGLDVDAIRFCATSAARDAANAADFAAGVRARLGVEAEVLSGDEEAALSYLGATRTLPNAAEPVLVVDIGGGSTEFVIGSRHASLDVGSVRMTERYLVSDPPAGSEIRLARDAVDAQLDTLSAAGIDLAAAATVVGVAGTITTTAAIALGLETYDRVAIHHARIATQQVAVIASRLLGMTVAARRAIGPMHPGRADVIGAGGLILDRIVARTTVQSILVSEHDILDGIAWSMASR